MGTLYALGLSIAMLQLGPSSPAIIGNDGQVFYGDWTIVDGRPIAANGDILEEVDARFTGSKLTIRKSGILISDDLILGVGFDTCGEVNFSPRMWTDFGYQRLAIYDVRRAFNLFNLRYEYNSSVYRLQCSNKDTNNEINHRWYDNRTSEPPENKNIPFDSVNFIYVSRNVMLMYSESEWLLLKRVS